MRGVGGIPTRYLVPTLRTVVLAFQCGDVGLPDGVWNRALQVDLKRGITLLNQVVGRCQCWVYWLGVGCNSTAKHRDTVPHSKWNDEQERIADNIRHQRHYSSILEMSRENPCYNYSIKYINNQYILLQLEAFGEGDICIVEGLDDATTEVGTRKACHYVSIVE